MNHRIYLAERAELSIRLYHGVKKQLKLHDKWTLFTCLFPSKNKMQPEMLVEKQEVVKLSIILFYVDSKISTFRVGWYLKLSTYFLKSNTGHNFCGIVTHGDKSVSILPSWSSHTKCHDNLSRCNYNICSHALRITYIDLIQTYT